MNIDIEQKSAGIIRNFFFQMYDLIWLFFKTKICKEH